MYHLDVDEYYGLLAIELCHTVHKFKPEKGSLSNYYKLRCESVLKNEYAKSMALKNTNNGVVPLTEYTDLCSGINVEELVEIEEMFDGEYGELLRMKMQGYNQSEIAEAFGVTQSYVSKLLAKLKEEYLDR